MTLRMRVLPRFPATITATNGLKVTRPTGTPNLIVEPDFGSLVQIPSVDDPENVFFWAWDRTLSLYRRMSFADLFEGVADLGFMQESVYDPQGKQQDIFAYADLNLRKAGGTMTGDIDMGGNKLSNVSSLNAGPLGGMRDVLINGDGAVNTRLVTGYTTVADDVYWCDRHYVLTQTAAITPTILADVANGLPSMMRLSQSQAAAQRMGNAQIVESYVSKRFRGKQATLGGWLRCSSAQAIRYAVLEWTGTADTVTSDVVNSWTNSSFTAGQFFLGANLTVAAVGTITPAANTLTKWSLTANISSSCNNLIVLMWTEGTAAQNVTLDMAWGLVQGDATQETYPYAPRHPQQERTLCQPYCRPAGVGAVGMAFSTTQITLAYLHEAMRATPSAAVISSSGNSGLIRIGGSTETATTIVPFPSAPNGGYIAIAGTGYTSSNGYFGVKNMVILDAEL